MTSASTCGGRVCLLVALLAALASGSTARQLLQTTSITMTIGGINQVVAFDPAIIRNYEGE
jgi:predicted phage tail protein